MQDFEIRIGEKLQDGTYEVVAKSETGGNAIGKMQVLWDDKEIEDALTKIVRCISYTCTCDPGGDLVKKLGDKFYKALLGSRDDSIGSFFERCIGIAGARNSGLRIRLWIELYELRKLPWEFVYRSRDSRFLATTHNFSVVRYEENQEMQKDLKTNLPLKILILTVNPEEESQKRVKRIISDVFNSHQDKFSPTFVDSPTITDLKKNLLHDKFQVIDFIGHGSLGTDEKCYLMLGNNQLISSTEFRNLVGGNDIRLILLNSCYTAVASRDPFLSMGSALTRAGIPAVIAMQYAMPFKSIEVFSDIFYTALAEFLPVDQCVTQARIILSAKFGEDKVNWTIPVLFMNAKDGVILKKGTEKSRPQKKKPRHTGITITGKNIKIGQLAGRDIVDKSVKIGSDTIVEGDIVTGTKVTRSGGDRKENQSDLLQDKANVKDTTILNPFIKGPMITEPKDFFGRKEELKKIFTLLQSMSSCSVIGKRRIGKSSLLYYIAMICQKRLGEAYRITYVDLQSAQCHTLNGVLQAISERLFHPVISKEITSSNNVLVAFEKNIKVLQGDGVRPVVCLDEFENLIKRQDEFTDDFFESWRSLGSRGLLAFITGSQTNLRKLCDDGKLTSPFYNIFSSLELGVFSNDEAWEFVGRDRPNVRFTDEEKEGIIQIAQGHPLKLQIACWHIRQAKLEGEFDLNLVLEKAQKEMNNMIRSY